MLLQKAALCNGEVEESTVTWVEFRTGDKCGPSNIVPS